MQQRDSKPNAFQYSLGNEDGSYQRVLTKIQMMLGQPSSSSSPQHSSTKQLSNDPNTKTGEIIFNNNSNETNNNNSSSGSGSTHTRNNSIHNSDNSTENASQKKGPKISIGSTRKNATDEISKPSKTDDYIKNSLPPLQHSNSLPHSTTSSPTTSHESSSLPSTPTMSRSHEPLRKSFDTAEDLSEEKSTLNRNRSFGKSSSSRKDFWSTGGSVKESATLTRRASVRVSGNDDMGRDRSITSFRSATGGMQKKKSGTLKRSKNNSEFAEPDTYETDFEFSSSQLSALPSEIGLLFWLKSCNLEDNQLSTLPTSIGELVMLETLKLSHNRITSLPDQIGQLKRLKVLMLDWNQLSKLPVGIGKMKLLEHLNINNNLITYLPSELSDCVRLQVLTFENNPLVFPPKNILSEGPVQTVGYLKTLLMGSKPSNRLKYFLLGKEQSGKSSLLTCLKTKKGRSKSKYIPSRGLDMDSWNMDVEIEEDKDVGKNTITNVNYVTYDFSGNGIDREFASYSLDMLMPLHEAFFSDFGIYCITWDMTWKEDGVAGLEFYLKAIDGKAKNASIIIVGTHLDDKMFDDDPNLADSLADKIIEKYCSDFPNIKGVVSVSCTSYKGIDFLRSTIERISATPPCVNYFYRDFIPLRYFALEDLILAEKSKRGGALMGSGSIISPGGGVPTLTWRKFLSLATIVSLTSDTMITGALDFLNYEVGTVLYFPDISDDLKSFLFLDPPSIYDAVNGVLGFNVTSTYSASLSGSTGSIPTVNSSPMSTPGENDQPGVFQHNTMDKIWPHFSKELKRGLLSMMISYKLILELPKAADTEIENQASILPFMLSPEPRESMQLVIPDNHIKLERSYMFSTPVPEAMFHLLLSSLHQLHFTHRKEVTKNFWRYGISLADSRDNAAQVTYVRSQQSLNIVAHGPKNPESLLREIVQTIELLSTNWFPSSGVECIIKFANMKLFMSDIEAAVSQNEKTFNCNGIFALSDIVPDLTLKDKASIRVEFSKLAIKREVGQGAFGLISEAEYQGAPVALKQITTTTKEETLQAYKDWYHELSVMSLLHHDNIANLVGFCGKPQCIIMEYVPCGTLFDFLRNPDYMKTGSFFDWDLILKIATDIAEGMNYMHSMTPPVVHRDLKTPNILVYSTDRNDKIMMKIADFGTATPLYIPELRERLVDQPLWLAPEVMLRKPYNQKVDVYAYAIILWELLTKEHPFDEFPFAQWSAQLEDSIIAGTRPTIPSNCLAGYKKLTTECWSSSPRQRPSFEVVLQQLNTIKSNLRRNADNNTVEEVDPTHGYKFDLPDTEDSIVLEEADNRDKYVTQIKAATPSKLVERFTREKERDFDYVMHFLLTCPMFCRPDDLLRLIKGRYEGPPATALTSQTTEFQKQKTSIRVRVLLILQKWLGLLAYEYDAEALNDIERVLSRWSNKVEDGEYPPGKVKVDLVTAQPTPELLQELKAFVKELEETSKDSMEKKVLSKLQRKKMEFLEGALAEMDPSVTQRASTVTKAPQRKPTQLGSENPMKTLDARELAEQWTLLECQFLQSIRPEEFLGQAWHREHKEKIAPNLSAYVDWFTQMRNWVSTEVLKGESSAERKDMIEFFIQVATRLFEMHNYNGVTEVLSSLHGDAMSQLQHSWKDVNKKSTEQLDYLTKMMSPHKNFRAYRSELKSIQNDTPYVPYLGVFLNDFIFLDETKEWHYPSAGSEMINFEKVKTIGESLMNFQTSQHVSRIFNSKIPVNAKIQEYVLSAEIWESDDLIRLAQLKEECKDKKVDSSRKYITGRSNIATDIDALSPREWDLLLTNARTIVFGKDEIVFEENSFNRMLYRIKSGKFRVEKKIKDNVRGLTNTVVARLEPPAMFGEMSFLGMRTTASIVCDEDKAELYVLEINLVKTLFIADADLFRIFYQYLATILAKRLKGVGQQSQPPSPSSQSSSVASTPAQSPGQTPGTSPGTTPGATPITSPGSSPHNSSSSYPSIDRRTTISNTKEAHKDSKEKPKKDKRKTQAPETGREEDIKFRKKFGLPEGEIIIKEFSATLKKVTGKLYLSQQYVCFYGTVFGMSRKKIISIQDIKDYSKGGKSSMVITVEDNNTKFLFSEDKERDAAYDMLESLFKTSKSRPTRSNGQVSLGTEELRRQIKRQDSESEEDELSQNTEDHEALTPEDWDDLLEGAKLLRFKKGDTIITEGENFQRIYQLVEGECRIEKAGKVLGKMEDGQFFGEISFLLSGGATATIVADSNEVDVYVLEGYFMNILFGIRPELAGRFYKHLANVLQKRIRSRDEALSSKKSFPPAPKVTKQAVAPVKRSVFMNNMSPEKSHTNNNNNNTETQRSEYNPYKMQKSGKVVPVKQNKRSSLVIVSKASELTTSQEKIKPVPVEVTVRSVDTVLNEQTESVKNLVNRYQNIISQKQTKQQ